MWSENESVGICSEEVREMDGGIRAIAGTANNELLNRVIVLIAEHQME